jgi:hypothetical protein
MAEILIAGGFVAWFVFGPFVRESERAKRRMLELYHGA